MVDFSVVVPVHNSEETIKELYSRLVAEFNDLGSSFEVIFVEDGSEDNSWNVLKKLKQEFPNLITAIKLNKNFGQHNATMCGFTFAKGEMIITIDDDLQNPPEEIKKLVETCQKNNSDITYGIYTKKQHNFARNVLSNGAKKSSKYFMKGMGKGSSFRLINHKIVRRILDHNISFIFIDEVLQWYTNNISFVDVEHKKRQYNKSGYSPLKLFNLASDLTYYYTNIPLKLMVYGGMIISVLSFLLALQFVIQKIFYNVPLGYTSVIVAILFSTSIIVFSLGVIGGYLSRIQLVQNKKPPFHIEELLD
ncbi:MAG: glycosyltransferase family 2 protein [Bacteroidetes bacterium]|nr:glycosyltransferase family 2 protein [Bacteroidota bacterium]MBL6944245.1 glycosyltransferase family 2 protein [Bacteroidales bacterium]